MKKNLKFLPLICIMLVSLFVLNPVNSLAQTNNTFPNEKEFEELDDSMSSIEQDNEGIEPHNNFKKVFFSGMLVGWYINGGIDYLTGKAPAAWVSWGLKNIENKIIGYLNTPLYSQAMVNSAGVVTAKCVVYPCPITSSDPEILSDFPEDEDQK